MFQFVESQRRGGDRPISRVVFQQWLTHGSLQIFAGFRWKEKLFHRVQRVDKKQGFEFSIPVENFKVRRVNFTFRYVPDPYIIPFEKLPKPTVEDILPYMEKLAGHSPFFEQELKKLKR